MNKKIERVKAHFQQNKWAYISGGIGVAAGSVGMACYRSAPMAKATQTVAGIVNIKPTQNVTQVVINLTERSTPSKPVHLVGTNLYFDSLSDAARKTGHSLSSISHVVNGRSKDVGGDVFVLLQPA